MKKEHYVYIHRRNDTGEIFYVGKGKGRRAYMSQSRNRWWSFVAKKHGFTVELVQEKLSVSDANALEMELIAKYGRSDLGLGSLVNLTDGGDGGHGVIYTEKMREEKRRQMTGNKHSLGRVLPDHEREARRVANLGQKRSKETKAKLSKARMGKGNGNYDATIRNFVHEDGRAIRCTSNDLAKIIGVKSSKVTDMVNPSSSARSCHGWWHEKVDVDGKRSRHKASVVRGEGHHQYSSTIYDFANDDGRQISATVYEMKNYHGCNSHISSVVSGKRPSHKGWRLVG